MGTPGCEFRSGITRLRRQHGGVIGADRPASVSSRDLAGGELAGRDVSNEASRVVPLVHSVEHRQQPVLFAQLRELVREEIDDPKRPRFALLVPQLRQRDQDRNEEALAHLGVVDAPHVDSEVVDQVHQRVGDGRRRRRGCHYPAHELRGRDALDQSMLINRELRRSDVPKELLGDLRAPGGGLDVDRPRFVALVVGVDATAESGVEDQAADQKEREHDVHQELLFYSLATVGISSLIIITSKAYEDGQDRKKQRPRAADYHKSGTQEREVLFRLLQGNALL